MPAVSPACVLFLGYLTQNEMYFGSDTVCLVVVYTSTGRYYDQE